MNVISISDKSKESKRRGNYAYTKILEYLKIYIYNSNLKIYRNKMRNIYNKNKQINNLKKEI